MRLTLIRFTQLRQDMKLQKKEKDKEKKHIGKLTIKTQKLETPINSSLKMV